MQLSLGKTLWWVASNNEKTQYEVTVTALGRKWAKLSNGHRVDVQSLEVEGGVYIAPGELFESKSAHEKYLQIEKENSYFFEVVKAKRGSWSLEQLAGAYRALGMLAPATLLN